MPIDVTSMIRPRSVAIVGASSKRMTQGNIVISNLKDWGYKGDIYPIHPQAREIDGFGTLNAASALPEEADVAIVAVPAEQVKSVLDDLENSAARAAIVFTNGFSADQEQAIRTMAATSRLTIHGPNCMGLINFTESVPLYPSRPSRRLREGKVAIVAQSGSAAISVMNSTVIGLSKVITMGSEFHVSAADYIRWLAGDDATTTIGVVAESIKDPVAFAIAAEAVHAAGKALVVLKVGRTATGIAATQAHTGAMVSDSDAYDDFFASTGIATVSDYDELIASLECAAVARPRVYGGGIGIIGISGGQTALACDAAELGGLDVAVFRPSTQERLQSALPGTLGNNPVDLGATVNAAERNSSSAIQAVLDDEGVGAIAVLQDAQESLNPITLENYMSVFSVYAESGAAAQKPLVVISPTSENVDPGVRDYLARHNVPLLRGLRPGLRAIDNLGRGKKGLAATWAVGRGKDRGYFHPDAADICADLADLRGSLTPQASFALLEAYGLPIIKSAVASTVEEAIVLARQIGFPLVVKVASLDILHRSDVGGVELGITDETALRQAIARIAANVAKAKPDAVIDGYELQEQVSDGIEAMAGFTAAPPFGQLVVVGTGGTLVELMSDRAVKLAPFDEAAAREMISGTKLARLMAGYRNLLPQTDMSPLVDAAVKLSRLASDMAGIIGECDLNPIMVQKATGRIRIVDALMIAGGANHM